MPTPCRLTCDVRHADPAKADAMLAEIHVADQLHRTLTVTLDTLGLSPAPDEVRFGGAHRRARAHRDRAPGREPPVAARGPGAAARARPRRRRARCLRPRGRQPDRRRTRARRPLVPVPWIDTEGEAHEPRAAREAVRPCADPPAQGAERRAGLRGGRVTASSRASTRR